ncbi:hypothetical protein B0I35DRAFT_434995 [Stachybotrys elegans]|uniref:Zn(2)-C6 fungal-type domain-containing protein n=1 Tax=Stachybotrys elegans TaxID=80388 RepID=A0A8K0SRG8_9HYPO|nr:hypothetical protein B0I35DRAFT_434995 [Stachybotrys elegans]
MAHEQERMPPHSSGAGSGASSGPGSLGMEPLACVSCRARKLKCDRTKPACARCLKVSNKCVYPESRRKPATKRRNVRELEARLAQVEDYLKEVNRSADKAASDTSPVAADGNDDDSGDGDIDVDIDIDVDVDADVDVDVNTEPYHMGFQGSPTNHYYSAGKSGASQQAQFAPDFSFGDFGNAQLMYTGLSEALPPAEMMEELNTLFFRGHYHINPVVHQARYYRSFYGSTLRKPPMSLQYAIWTLASLGHDKYGRYTEALYKRARQYAEADEIKDYDENQIPISQAQCWVLISTFEAKQMLFTRAAMSNARAVRLVHMMGLHDIDNEEETPSSWTNLPMSAAEKEERRRIFWGAFVLDWHASVATGWPSLIKLEDSKVRLPSSEEAFQSGKEEKTAWLEEVYDGAPYSGFAATLIACHVLKSIAPQALPAKSSDRPQDFLSGPFWKRHREIDAKLRSLLMHVPDRLRLSNMKQEPAAVSLHATLQTAVICLYHSAIEKAYKYNMAEEFKKACLYRLKAAADEAVAIMKTASPEHAALKSSFGGMTPYVAASVYIYTHKLNPWPGLSSTDESNLQFLVRSMEKISRTSAIAEGTLREVYSEIERHHLSSVVKPSPEAAVRISMRPPPDPSGRLLLKATRSAQGQPNGPFATTEPPSLIQPRNIVVYASNNCFQGLLGALSRNLAVAGTAKKQQEPGMPTDTLNLGMAVAGDAGRVLGTNFTPIPSGSSDTFWMGGLEDMTTRFPLRGGVLPDRTNSSTASSPQYQATTSARSASSHTSPSLALGSMTEDNMMGQRTYQEGDGMPLWQATAEPDLLSQTEAVMNFALSGDGTDPWGVLTESSTQWTNDCMDERLAGGM